MKGRTVPVREYISYGVGSLGKGLLDSFVSTFILIYFTDAVGLLPAVGGVIIFVAKILVMIGLPFAGIKMDGTKSKWGRFRPYVLWLSFITAIFTVILFVSPDLYQVTGVAKIILCFFAYLFWEIVFNLHDVPFWSLSSVVSSAEDERSVFLSIADALTTAGGLAPVLAVPYLVDTFGNVYGYVYAGLIFGLSGGILAFCSFFVKERITVPADTVSLKKSFKALFSNKPFLIFNISLLAVSLLSCYGEASTYLGKYLYDVDGGKILYPNGTPSFWSVGLYLSALVVAGGIGSLAADAVFPFLLKKFQLKKSFVLVAAITIPILIGFFFIGYNKIGNASPYIVLLLTLVCGFSEGLFFAMKCNLIPECADYGEWKNGVRQDGTLFSVQVMLTQIYEALPVLVVSLLLQFSGYIEPVGEETVTQSETVRQTLYAGITLLPAVGVLLGCIPVCFYKYDGKLREKVRKELSERHKEG